MKDIDFTKTALVLIDLQKGLFQLEETKIVEKFCSACESFREQNGFISFVRVDFQDGKDALIVRNRSKAICSSRKTCRLGGIRIRKT